MVLFGMREKKNLILLISSVTMISEYQLTVCMQTKLIIGACMVLFGMRDETNPIYLFQPAFLTPLCIAVVLFSACMPVTK